VNLRKIATRIIRFIITIMRLVYRAIPLPPAIRNSINAVIYRRLAWVQFQMLLRELTSNWTVRDEEIPKVSIIIPVFGKVEVTLRCIRSIASNPQKNSFEVIVVNDGSKDSTKDWIGKLSGVRLINNQENLGFIQSCNNGAAAARGEFLHFLNNDTIVTSNWLDELVWTHESFTDVGLVGSKLLYPDGKLQEAGAIVWQDGSAWNYGRGHDPDRPEYNYARQVDYCSGASLLISKENFQKLGGFDTHFSPAYYEDTDLAQKVTKRGLKVIYQPASVVYHIEGSTSGKDLTQGTKQYQVTNGEKFASRWADELANHGKPGENPDQEKDRFAKKRILFLDHLVPTPDKDAGSGVAINTMLLLREFGFQVTFAAPKNLVSDRSEALLLQKNGIEVLHHPYVESLEEHLEIFGSRYDLILVCRADILEYSLPIIENHCPGMPVVFHTADLHFLRLEREANLTKDWAIEKKAEEYRRLEPWLMEQTDLTLVHGSYEKELLVSMGVDSKKIVVVPLILEVPSATPSFDEREGIVFVGGFNHTPNVDAVKYMCNEIMPLLLERGPEIVLSVVGSNITQEILDLEAENVRVLGYVDSVDEVFGSSKISIAPLRFGAGLKGKVAKSLACGTPVVSSAIGVEGMILDPEKEYALANTTEEFVDKIISLYGSSSIWREFSIRGKEQANRLWGFDEATSNLASILNQLGFDLTPPKKRISFH
jgi:GT2 family glycosyltransferase/glycosyltransferase involved in cell wall biosynthesis